MGQTPEYMRKYLIKRREFHNHNLRSNEEFSRPQFRKRIAQNSLIFKGIELYNGFKKKFPEILNENELKRELNKFVKIKFQKL